MPTQNWTKWPGDSTAPIVIEGDAVAMKKALENAAIYRYWNIKVTPEGNFRIVLVDPSTYESHYIVLQKPEWLPNVYDMPGYVTVTAKKQSDITIHPAPFFHADEIKIFK